MKNEGDTMKRSLLDTVFQSEKRKRLLLLLEKSPKTIEYIVDELETSRQGLLPQIKILNDQKLVEKKNGTVQLTAIGKLLTNEVKKIVNTVDILEINYDYWTTRDFSAIPDQLFKKMGEFCPCQIAELKLNEMFEFAPELIEGMAKSEYVFACASFLHPSYPSIFQKLATNSIQTSVILTKNAIVKLEADFKNNYEIFLQAENTSMYDIGEIKIPGMIVTDNFILLWLFNDKGDFEPRYMISQSETAINWGKDFFEYYRNIAKKMTDSTYSI